MKVPIIYNYMRIGYTWFLLVLLFSSAVFSANGVVLEEEIDPHDISISGTVEDNYTNLTYSLTFDNSEGSNDKTGYQEIQFPRNLFLSNVTAKMGEEIYYGIVQEVSQAEEEYEEAVEQNKSAILVKSLGDNKYGFELNVKRGKKLTLSAIVEGFNTRKLGLYRIDLLNLLEAPRVDFTVDIDLFTTLSTYKSIKLLGLGPASITELDEKNGYNINFDQDNYLLSQQVNIEYTLSEMDPGGTLLSYTNGTQNYFIYLLAPEIQNPEDQSPKEYVFVFDTSGSMNTNERIDKAKASFKAIIGTLNAQDRFNVIAFEASILALWENTKVASEENINEAKNWVGDRLASGGTNIDSALKTGLQSFDKEFTAAKALTLLSDGQPTAGETNSKKIRSNAINANTNEVAIFTVAFGEATSEGLMAQLAYDTGGNFQKIADDANTEEQLLNFYEEFSTPIATDFSITYTNAVDIFPVSASLKGPLFNGSEVLQAGRFSGPLSINTKILFNTGIESFTNEILEPSSDLPHIKRIWAINKIKNLVNIANIEGLNETLRDQIVSTAIEFGIVVEGYTAILIVIDKPNDAQNTTDQEDGVPAAAPTVRTVTGNVDQIAGGYLGQDRFILPLLLLVGVSLLRRRHR